MKTSKEIWNNSWSKDNRMNSASTLLGGAATMFTAAKSNAEIADTSGIDAFNEGVKNTTYSYGSFDNLDSEFDTKSLARTNYTGKELRGVTPGQMALNTLSAVGSGISTGAKLGGIWGGVFGGLAGLGSGLIGIGIGNNNASIEAGRVNKEGTNSNNYNLGNYNNSIRNTKNMTFRNSISAYGGPLFNHSENFDNGITFINAGGTHEENPLGGVPVGVDQNGTPNLVEEGEVIWNDYVFSNRLKPTKKQLEEAGYKNKYEGLPFSKVAKKIQQGAAERVNDQIAIDSMNDALSQLTQMQEVIRMKKEANKNKFKYGGKFGNVFEGPGDEGNFLNGTTELVGSYIDALPWWRKALTLPEIKEAVETVDTALKPPPKTDTSMPWQFNLRYASPLIHGITFLNNLKKPDYSSADRIDKAAQQIPGGSFTPLGDYINLEPLDRNYYLNPLLATSRSNARNIQNQGLNAGQTMAGLLANNYNTQRNIGTTLMQMYQENMNRRLQEATFNRGTNQVNSQMGLQALAMDQQRANNILNATAQSSAMRNSIDAMRSQALSSSLTGIADDLGSIGREDMDRQMLMYLADKGVIKTANGGFLTRRKRRTK